MFNPSEITPSWLLKSSPAKKAQEDGLSAGCPRASQRRGVDLGGAWTPANTLGISPGKRGEITVRKRDLRGFN